MHKSSPPISNEISTFDTASRPIGLNEYLHVLNVQGWEVIHFVKEGSVYYLLLRRINL